MLISTEKTSPLSSHDEGGIPWGAWFGLANSVAQGMRLHTNPKKHASPDDTIDDSIDTIGRRAWWSLIVLDRWHAAGGATAPQIPDSVAVLGPADLRRLGIDLYHLARKYY